MDGLEAVGFTVVTFWVVGFCVDGFVGRFGGFDGFVAGGLVTASLEVSVVLGGRSHSG